MICAICQGDSSSDTESERYCPACEVFLYLCLTAVILKIIGAILLQLLLKLFLYLCLTAVILKIIGAILHSRS